jgi:hypothetical protein
MMVALSTFLWGCHVSRGCPCTSAAGERCVGIEPRINRMAEDDKGSSAGRLKTFFTSLPGILTGLAAVLTAIAAVAGVFLTRGGSEGGRDAVSTSAQNPRSRVELLAPQPGQMAGKMRVSFRYSHVGRDSDLWLVERSDEPKYYPQPRCPGEQPTVDRLPSEQGDIWSQNGVDVGAGELLVVLTSKQASQLLSEQIRDWCNKAPWPGIASLPEDAKVEAKVLISG